MTSRLSLPQQLPRPLSVRRHHNSGTAMQIVSNLTAAAAPSATLLNATTVASAVVGLTMWSLLLAQSGRGGVGRACPLCPGKSDISLFCYGQGIIDLDAQDLSDAFIDTGPVAGRCDNTI